MFENFLLFFYNIENDEHFFYAAFMLIWVYECVFPSRFPGQKHELQLGKVFV
jgi:hypothetical protein